MFEMSTNIFNVTFNGQVNVNFHFGGNGAETPEKDIRDNINPEDDNEKANGRSERRTQFTYKGNDCVRQIIKEVVCESQKQNLEKNLLELEKCIELSKTGAWCKNVYSQEGVVNAVMIGPSTTKEEIQISNSSSPESLLNLANNLPIPSLSVNTRPNSQISEAASPGVSSLNENDSSNLSDASENRKSQVWCMFC